MNWYKKAQEQGIRLWLDDIRPMPPDFNFYTKTANEAISKIKELMSKGETLEAISLDHDLGAEEAGTGYQVASFIEQHAFSGELKRIVHMAIHSANPVGVQKMKTALQNAKRFWDKNEEISSISEK